MKDQTIRAAFSRMWENIMNKPLAFEEYCHTAIAFTRQHIQTPIYLDQDIFDTQSGHSPQTASEHYALSTSDHRRVDPQSMLKYAQASFMWHCSIYRTDFSNLFSLLLFSTTNSFLAFLPSLQHQQCQLNLPLLLQLLLLIIKLTTT